MIKLNGKVTDECNFFKEINPFDLIKKYGSPLYVYSEDVLRERIRDVAGMCPYPRFGVNYSAKANSNPSILKIAREEGCHVDALSVGEIEIGRASCRERV